MYNNNFHLPQSLFSISMSSIVWPVGQCEKVSQFQFCYTRISILNHPLKYSGNLITNVHIISITGLNKRVIIQQKSRADLRMG